MGVFAALVVYPALLAAASALIVRGTIAEDSVAICIWLFAFFAAFIGAEVSAGRFGFLWWLVPLHIVYPVALTLAAKYGLVANLGTLIAWFDAASAARFLFCLFSFLRRSR